MEKILHALLPRVDLDLVKTSMGFHTWYFYRVNTDFTGAL